MFKKTINVAALLVALTFMTGHAFAKCSLETEIKRVTQQKANVLIRKVFLLVNPAKNRVFVKILALKKTVAKPRMTVLKQENVVS